jgi:hypothetical protein
LIFKLEFISTSFKETGLCSQLYSSSKCTFHSIQVIEPKKHIKYLQVIESMTDEHRPRRVFLLGRLRSDTVGREKAPGFFTGDVLFHHARQPLALSFRGDILEEALHPRIWVKPMRGA